MAASAAVAQPVAANSSPAASHDAAMSTRSITIMPNPNPTNIHEALVADTISAVVGQSGPDLTTGSGPRNRHGSTQSNHSVRAGFFSSQNRLSRGSFGSGTSLGSLGIGDGAKAYGDKTGTKGWGTGNSFEHSTRVPAIEGVYGSSTGTKGWGTGNDFEIRRDSHTTKSTSRRGSLSGHSASPEGFRATGHTSQTVPADAVSVSSRRSSSATFGEKLKDAVTSKFKKSDSESSA